MHFVVNAQRNIHSPNLNKFVGTWTYNKDGKEFEITLYVATVKIPNQNVTVDAIEGFHVYKLNGNNVDVSKGRPNPSFHGNVEDRTDPNTILFSFFDELKQKSADGIMTFIPGNPDKVTWHLRNPDGLKIRTNGQAKFDTAFTVPDHITLDRKK